MELKCRKTTLTMLLLDENYNQALTKDQRNEAISNAFCKTNAYGI